MFFSAFTQHGSAFLTAFFQVQERISVLYLKCIPKIEFFITNFFTFEFCDQPKRDIEGGGQFWKETVV